jgi:hypothetical protein
MCARLVQLTDDVLSTSPWTREGEDARRLLRVAVKQMQWRADATGDPLLIATVYDSLANERLHHTPIAHCVIRHEVAMPVCPHLKKLNLGKRTGRSPPRARH